MAVSRRMPPKVKKRVARLAKAQEVTRAKFHAEGKRRLARMKISGLAIPAAEVFDYLERRALGKSAVRPKARRIA